MVKRLHRSDNGHLEDAIMALVDVVRDEPEWAIRKAAKAFVEGRVVGRRALGFVPMPDEFAVEVRRQSAWAREAEERDRKRRREIEEVAPMRRAGRRDTSNHYALEINGASRFSHDEWLAFQRSGRLPSGSFWRAMGGEIFLPLGSELGPETEAGPAATGDGLNLYPDRDEWHRLHVGLPKRSAGGEER